METSEPNKPQKRRWNWRQYSISTLLIAVTIVSLGLGLVTNRARQQRRAVAAIRAAGGAVWYDFEGDDGSPNEPPGPDWLRGILGVDYFADVVGVTSSGMTDRTCSHLSALTSLQKLYLNDAQVTDAGVAHLAGLTSLKWLWLSDTQVTDAGLAHLSGLTSLQALWLIGTRVTDNGCDKLQQALPNCSVVR